MTAAAEPWAFGDRGLPDGFDLDTTTGLIVPCPLSHSIQTQPLLVTRATPSSVLCNQGRAAVTTSAAGGDPAASQRLRSVQDLPAETGVVTADNVAVWRQQLGSLDSLDQVGRVTALRNRPMAWPAGSSDAVTDLLRAQALLESTRQSARVIAHAQARQAQDLAELASIYPSRREYLAQEISMAWGVSESCAQDHLDNAEALTTRLPGTLQAMLTEGLPQWKVTALRKGTENLTDIQARQVEKAVLPGAHRMTVPALREAIARQILLLDPDGASERHDKAKARRSISVCPLDDGMAQMNIYSTAQDIETIRQTAVALGVMARTPDDPKVADCPEIVGQRQVDALVDLCADILDAGMYQGQSLPKRQRNKPHVQVTMPLSAVLGGDAPCELGRYGPISATQARDILADATIQRLVCDDLTGTVLDVGRQRYKPPKSLADHVIARDLRCTAPGCRRPAAETDLDHIKPWDNGGTTSAANLAPVCRHHHRAKTSGGYSVVRDPGGGLTWTSPLGQTVTTDPVRRWYPEALESASQEPDTPETRTVAEVFGIAEDQQPPY